MDEQIILACDDAGRFTGEYISKAEGHAGDGRRHLAIAVLVYDEGGRVLLQRRRHALFDDVWDITGATHPLHRADGSDETFEEATRRCLEREYGIVGAEPQQVGAFIYAARDGDHSENEYCAMLIAEHNQPVTPNPDVAYECAWVEREAFALDIAAHPERYAPWAVEAARVLREVGFLSRD